MDWTVIVGLAGPVAGVLIVVVDRWLQRHQARALARKAAADADKAVHNGYAGQVEFWRTEANELRQHHEQLEAELKQVKTAQERHDGEIRGLRAEVEQARAALVEFARGARILIAQLVHNGLEPDWRPARPLESYCEELDEERGG